MSEQVVADLLSDVVRDIAAQCDRSASIGRALHLAPEVVRCDLADIVQVRHSGSLALVHSSDVDRSAMLNRVADAVQESPAASCRSAAVPATICNLDGDHRWPGYARAAFEATGLRSEMVIGLEGTDEGLVLRFFSEQSEAWSDADRREATAFAELTAMAIDRMSLRETAQNLRKALDTNRLIGAAIGILMAGRRVTYGQAFDLLRLCSQNSNRRLASIADDVVLTGDLPSPPGSGAA